MELSKNQLKSEPIRHNKKTRKIDTFLEVAEIEYKKIKLGDKQGFSNYKVETSTKLSPSVSQSVNNRSSNTKCTVWQPLVQKFQSPSIQNSDKLSSSQFSFRSSAFQTVAQTKQSSPARVGFKQYTGPKKQIFTRTTQPIQFDILQFQQKIQESSFSADQVKQLSTNISAGRKLAKFDADRGSGNMDEGNQFMLDFNDSGDISSCKQGGLQEADDLMHGGEVGEQQMLRPSGSNSRQLEWKLKKHRSSQRKQNHIPRTPSFISKELESTQGNDSSYFTPSQPITLPDTIDCPLDTQKSFTHKYEAYKGILPRTVGGTSQYRGVSWHTQTHRWKAQIKVDGKDVNLGRHKEEITAAKAYDKAAICARGSKLAKTNFPIETYDEEELRRLGDLSVEQLATELRGVEERLASQTSKYQGVRKNKRTHKWEAYLRVRGTHVHLGCYEREDDAAVVYDQAAIIRFAHDLSAMGTGNPTTKVSQHTLKTNMAIDRYQALVQQLFSPEVQLASKNKTLCAKQLTQMTIAEEKALTKLLTVIYNEGEAIIIPKLKSLLLAPEQKPEVQNQYQYTPMPAPYPADQYPAMQFAMPPIYMDPNHPQVQAGQMPGFFTYGPGMAQTPQGPFAYTFPIPGNPADLMSPGFFYQPAMPAQHVAAMQQHAQQQAQEAQAAQQQAQQAQAQAQAQAHQQAQQPQQASTSTRETDSSVKREST